MKKLGIIIPHYNSAKKIRRLINSIPKEYLEIIDIVIVDDKSSEKEIRDLKEYTYLNENIRIIENKTNKKNAGVARNIGLQNLETKWVLFADSDDFFLKESFKEILKYLNSDLDIVYFNVTSQYELTGLIAKRHLYIEELILNHEKDIENIKYKYYVPWGKLMNLEFIKGNRIFFDEVKASNDCFFSIKTGHMANKIEVNRTKIYCVTRGIGTLTTNMSQEIFVCRLKVWLNVNKFLIQNDKSSYQKPMLEYLVKASKYGIKSFIETTYIILLNKNSIFPRGFFNPKIFFEKLKKCLEEYKEMKEYGEKKLKRGNK